ncbi:hypothetical protein L1785_10480 [Antribacter sp. KLBMP9083]|uniref:Uncharacterized protein n=1 Tax=Antribacter soli TaxID=2910976 RepID=A0AA41QE03_9MICO|nr:hypothetical protein [Antribacter soli]MCF4121406.1 hypothetical protein [Antribacter soli]
MNITERVDAAIATAVYDVVLPIDTMGVTFSDDDLAAVAEAYAADPAATIEAADVRFAQHMDAATAAASDDDAEEATLRARAALALKERLESL